MKARGWEQCDFIYVIGDAYVDHPSFGHAIISRVLEAAGYKVGIISQPDWKKPESVGILGEPRLAFLVSSGNMDSMVNHYSVSKHRRKTDSFSPGGRMGLRPDRACTVYCNLIRQTFKDKPIVIGGIEASLRRLAHYDYWSDRLRRSVLLDSQADILLYGMGEKSIVEVANALNEGLSPEEITWVPGSVFKVKSPEAFPDYLTLPSFEEVRGDKRRYAESFMTQYRNADPFHGRGMIEPYGPGEFVVQNPPQAPLSQAEMDAVYDLPYMRTYHPCYEKQGGVPAIAEVRFSLTSCRGCYGACNFCALTFHQGRIIQARSHASLLKEAEAMTKDPEFKGYIADVGGPTANFRRPACDKQLRYGACPEQNCLFPKPCKNLQVTHRDYLSLLRKLRALPGVKKVFIRSGIRFDYLMADKDDTFFRELCKYHISGQLKVAPEHISPKVLDLMGKPRREVYESFVKKYKQVNESLHMDQYTVPYLMSSHPGCGMKEAVELAEYVRDLGYMPEQVQDFYPTPSTISTCIYYTGLDPRTGKPVYVPRDPKEKAMQRALIQYRDPKNRKLVLEALQSAGREDLIGSSKSCLVSGPKKAKEKKEEAKKAAPRDGRTASPKKGEACGRRKK